MNIKELLQKLNEINNKYNNDKLEIKIHVSGQDTPCGGYIDGYIGNLEIINDNSIYKKIHIVGGKFRIDYTSPTQIIFNTWKE